MRIARAFEDGSKRCGFIRACDEKSDLASCVERTRGQRDPRRYTLRQWRVDAICDDPVLAIVERWAARK
jgi:hypothetical protein